MSIGVMAPTLAVSATGVEPARLIGTAAPLAFLAAALGIGLIAYGFVRLSGTFSHASSVYAYTARALGPRAGFFAGWAMLGTSLVFPAVSMTAFAQFGAALLAHAGIVTGVAWLPLGLIGWAIMRFIASREIRTATRSLLAVELVSLVLVLALVVVIVASILGGSDPGGHARSLGALFELADGADISTIGLAATFGLLSFAGFEAAGSLGEESRRPTSAIPRSVIAAVLVGAVVYVVCIAVQTLGFGTDGSGIRAYASSQAPLGDLARTYAGGEFATVLDAAAVVSAVGAGVGCASVAARMLLALGRDGLLGAPFAAVSPRCRAPIGSLAAVLALDAPLLVSLSTAGVGAQRAFFFLATFGVLNLLVMYIVANLAAVGLLAARGRRLELALPLDLQAGQEQHVAEELAERRAALAGTRVVNVGGRRLIAGRAVVVATGSEAAVPPIPGLAEAQPWTNREATTSRFVPERLVVLGGGVVGVELAQAWQTLGSHVTLVEAQPRLLGREEPFAAQQVRDALAERGIELLLGRRAVAVSRDGGGVTVRVDSGHDVTADELLGAVGRRPATGELGLDAVGLQPGRFIDTDDALRAAGSDWLFAIGDCNGRALLTHMGKYQARIAADVILGRDARIDGRATA